MNNEKKLIHRVNRAIGQLNAVKDKLEDETYNCEEIMVLLKAAKGAVTSLEREIIKENLRKCVDSSRSKKQLKDQLESLMETMS